MSKKVKYLIIGAGPAGLQMAYYLKKADLDYVIIEKNNTAGSFYKKFPIHRELISINKKNNYYTEETFNMRHDWNSLLSEDSSLKFTKYTDELFPSADLLYKYLNDFSEKMKLNIIFNSVVKSVKKNSDGLFEVEIANAEPYLCEILMVGTGAVSQYMPEEIDGIENTIPYSAVSADKSFFENKRVAVLGGGNSAFETANHIINVAAHVHVLIKSPLKMAYETHFVGDLRTKYTTIFDMYQLKSLHAILMPNLKKLTKLDNGVLKTNHEYDYPESKVKGTLKLSREYDYVINCTGFNYTHQNLFAPNTKPSTIENNKFYALNENWESVNIPNMYFIGTTMQAIDRQSASGFIHGYRYNIRTLSNLLLEKFENIPYPNQKMPINPFNVFLDALYTRFSIADSIFQLYGFLGDMLVFNEEEDCVEWYTDLPVDYIHKIKDENKKVLQLTLEFGFHKHPGKPSMQFLGPSDPHDTKNSAFLHPVIRYYHKGIESEFHFGDSLLGRWDMPHNEGGAIASYHVEFYNWMAEIFEIEKIPLDNIGENPIFEKWD
ncbi:MAG: thioredoxin reductase [Planctomycetota bacterium]|jgi:thioredoxin reductase